MVSCEVFVQNQKGIHLRVAELFCIEATKHSCRVEIQSDKKTVNGKSVLSVLGAGIKCGDTITIVCDGAGEETALEKLTLLLKSN